MSGHSKWSTIKRKKAATDAKRGKLWTKLLREIQVAARTGGAPEGNPRLKTAIQSAKAGSVSNDAIERAVKRGLGADDGENLEEVLYEGYGPGGVALLIKSLTDNRNRTASEVRHALTRSAGSLGGSNTVTYLFNEKGVVLIPKSAIAEDKVFELALEAGADDIADDGEQWNISTALSSFSQLRTAFDFLGDRVQSAIKFLPTTTVAVSGEVAESLLELLERLEDLDDVQEVISNFEIEDAELSRISETMNR